MDPSDQKPSGWYPDDSNPLIQRWWNGVSWGDQTRPVNGALPLQSVPMSTPQPTDPYAPTDPPPPPATSPLTTRGQFGRLNPIGRAGLVLAVIGIVFNFFCIPSALAIILCAIGLYRIRTLKPEDRRAAGWIFCLFGILLGFLGTVIYVAGTIR